MSKKSCGIVFLLCCVALQVHAYDPTRATRGGSLVWGTAYSPYDAFTTNGSIASAKAIDSSNDTNSLSISMGNVYSFLQYADFVDVAKKINTLIEDGAKNLESVEEAKSFRTEITSILNTLENHGLLIHGIHSTSITPTISWTNTTIDGNFYFSSQREPEFGKDIPYAFAMYVTSKPVGFSDSCGAIDNENNSDTVNFDPNTCRLESDSSIYVRFAKSFINNSFGYSKVFAHLAKNDVGDKNNTKKRIGITSYLHGALIYGIRINYFEVETNTASVRIDDQNITTIDALYKKLTTQSNSKRTGGYDFDVGIRLVSNRYTLGTSLSNIFTPKIAYRNEKNISPGMPLSIDGSFFILPKSKKLSFSFQRDINGHTDPVGIRHKWQVFALGYTGNSLWIPNIAMGKRYSLLDDKLSYTTIAATFFTLLRTQIAFTDQNIGTKNKIPRSAIIGIQLGIDF